MSFVNWRYQQFEGTYVPVLITDEPQTIEFHTDWNAYGIQLSEVPQKATPSTLSIEEAGTGTPTTFTEVPFNQAPGAGEFRVDYETTNQFGTGRIQFNGADDGKQVLVTYYGLGTIVSPDNLALALDQEDLTPATITVSGASTFSGGYKTGGSDLFLKIKLDIGAWNMDSTATLNVAHGLDHSKIISVMPMIRNDVGTFRWPIDFYDVVTGVSGFCAVDATNVTLGRVTSGFFDNTTFDDTGISRGTILIEYLV